MELTLACTNILKQLSDLLNAIRHEDFVRPASTLSNSTVGQHVRHTLEFFLCLEKGLDDGTINYDKRMHDKLIENDKLVALSTIERVRRTVEQMYEKPLLLEVGYDMANDNFVTVETTAMRELVYNIEHAVHHMAIIKIGVREIANYVELPPDFGIAASTIRYQESVSSH
ncbi:MAG: DinB family protein [Chryseolinea sp.]